MANMDVLQNGSILPTSPLSRGSLTGRPIQPIRASALCDFKAQPKWQPLFVPALPVLPDGVPRGSIVELLGRRSAGRTSALLHVLAQATRRGEVCALVDTDDNFHPASAAEAGVRLDRLVWVRCRGNAEHAMRSADLLLHAGGFGVVALDLCETALRVLNRIPISYWFRFQRAIESTPTILLVSARSSQARSCSINALELELKVPHWSGQVPFRLLQGFETMVRPQRPAYRKAQKLITRVWEWGQVPAVPVAEPEEGFLHQTVA
jgi:recA bacterial DNA recombination protein